MIVEARVPEGFKSDFSKSPLRSSLDKAMELTTLLAMKELVEAQATNLRTHAEYIPLG
jgi:hypothetical protein